MFHVERLGLRDDCRVVGLYDDCPAVRERHSGGPAVMHSEWRRMLGDPGVELVLLAAPPAVHAELAISALAAGKHVVVETPLCLSPFEGEAILDASRRSGRSVIVAQTRRWDDDFRMAQATLASGNLGRPVALKLINWHYNPKSRRSLRAERRSTEFEVGGTWHWRDHVQTGGGVLWEFGSHSFDQLLRLAGRPPESVFARTWGAPDGCTEDAFLAVVNFPGNLVAHVEVNRAAAAPLSTGWMIVGTAGSYSGAVEYVPTAAGEVVDLPISSHGAEVDEFYGRIARHIRLGGPNPVPAEDAQAVLTLISAVRESARTGVVVHIAR